MSLSPALCRRLPPLIVGVLAITVLGRVDSALLGAVGFAPPVLLPPTWSAAAMVEIILPLAIAVLVVQNGQGIAVLKAAGHEQPIDAITVACGAGALASSAVAAVSTCPTGPTDPILTASGERQRQFKAGLFTGMLVVILGLMAPAFTRLALAEPESFIMTLAGLAMLPVLQAAFVVSFRNRFTFGALVLAVVSQRTNLAARPRFDGRVG